MMGNPELNNILINNLEKYGDTVLGNMDEHTIINGKSVRISALETLNTGSDIYNNKSNIYGKFKKFNVDKL